MKWYYELDLEGNTFLSDRNKLIGYDEVLDEVLYSVVSGNVVFIQGGEGSGKTAILKRVIKKFRGKGKVAYVNCKKLEQDLNIEGVITNKYGWWSRLLGKKMKGMILLVDNVDELNERNNERIKYFFDNNYVRSVIFTGVDYKKVGFTKSMKDRVWKVIKLDGLSEDNAVEVLRDRLEGNTEVIGDEDIKLLFNKSKSNVKLFLENADKVFSYAFEELKEKQINSEHVEQVLSGKNVVKEEKKPVEKKAKKKTKKEEEDDPIDNVGDEAQIIIEEPEISIGNKKEGLSDVQQKYNEHLDKTSKEKKDVAEDYY